MGALFRAKDPRIGRYVAIKLLRPGYDTPELRERFSTRRAPPVASVIPTS